jgi:hypothetical protein
LYEFPIEVFQSPRVNLSPNIKNITLVSRNLKYRSDTLQHFESRNNKLIKDNTRLNIDSITINACFDSLSAKLYQQQHFSKIKILPVTTLPVQYLQKINPPTKAQVQKIASDTQADALILLDMFSTFYSIYPVSDDNKQVAQVVTASIWTIYDPLTYRILQHQSMIDSLYWDGLDEQGHYQSSRIPAKKDAIAIAAGLAGAKYSKNLAPYWRQVNRQIFSSKKEEFTKASALVKKNKWEEASAIWANYTDSKNKRFRLQAMYNLAVAHEMEGDIEGAQQLLTEALAIAPAASCSTEKKSLRAYSAILAKRKMELEKINVINYEK